MQNDGPGEAVVCSEPSSGAGPDPESGSGGGGAAMAPVLCIVISRPEDVADLKAGYAAADGGPDLKAGDRDEAAAIAAAVSRCESEREQCRYIMERMLLHAWSLNQGEDAEMMEMMLLHARRWNQGDREQLPRRN